MKHWPRSAMSSSTTEA